VATTELKTRLAERIAAEVGLSVEEILDMLEAPRQPEHGDLALPCFRLAKTLRKPPPKIAEELREKLLSGQLPAGVTKVETVAGYLNFTFATAKVGGELLRQVLSAGGAFGGSEVGKGQRIVLEFSSVNVAKPFGIGHLRSTIIGAALQRVYDKLGYETISINHLGDWGTQFGKLIVAYRMWGDEYKLGDDAIYDLYRMYVRYHEAAEQDLELEKKGREEFRRLEAGDPENRRLWERFTRLSLKYFDRIYDLLGVEFDHITGESFYEDKMDGVLEQMQEKGLLTVSEGATVVDLGKYDMPACLVRRSDGASLYATRDLAALLSRKQNFDFDKILYVVGSAQDLHFRQFFKVAELMSNHWVRDQAVHVGFGWVKFSGQMMSTRSGTLIFFEDVINKARELAREIVVRENPDIDNVDWTAEKVAIAAIIFTQLRVRRSRDVNFIWEDALSFRGDTGPYLQYTHARLSSLSRNYGKPLPDLDADFSLLGDEEKQVIKLFENYPTRLQTVVDTYETSPLADYLLELAGAMNSYWQRIRILTDNSELTRARMQMAHAVREVIADGLRLLGLEPLERM
jgi:arginyl-tRNA synthetase